ncbi:pentapeptide repeat-containing protein [Streptomyces antnestii]|uniref:pentapeptide repeat-containing protein n=1 Tax=Streptomyces antnestii TaxID=2494256 RepID=UPI001674F63F|nr:pentapeptide repeat-containing protein [Streptomyces sp. San01]
MERIGQLVVSLSTLAATLLAVVSIQQVGDEQRINKEAHITDRYTAAGAQLGSTSVDVRLAGIYALQRIMQDSPRDQPTIINLMCAYVRNHAALPRKQAPASEHEPDPFATVHNDEVQLISEAPKADVAAALDVIAKRDPRYDGGSEVDLSHTDLSFARLEHARLAGASLDGARLIGADFRGSDLSGAEINYADTRLASFEEADMRRVQVAGTDLKGASLAATDLRGAIDLQRGVVLNAMPNILTKLPRRLAVDPRVIKRQREIDCRGGCPPQRAH